MQHGCVLAQTAAESHVKRPSAATKHRVHALHSVVNLCDPIASVIQVHSQISLWDLRRCFNDKLQKSPFGRSSALAA